MKKGAAFRGAGMLKQFKVKDNRVKQNFAYGIEVEYEAEGSDKNTLVFASQNHTNSKKTVSFKKTEDFKFVCAYDQTTG